MSSSDSSLSPRRANHPRRFDRRELVRELAGSAGALAALSVIPAPAAAALPEMPYWMLDLVRERLGTTAPREGRVELALPDRADTGLSVPLEVSVPGSPMTAEDHVKSMHVLTTRNPQPPRHRLLAHPALGGCAGRAAHPPRAEPVRLRVRAHERRIRVDDRKARVGVSRRVRGRDLPPRRRAGEAEAQVNVGRRRADEGAERRVASGRSGAEMTAGRRIPHEVAVSRMAGERNGRSWTA